MNKHDLITKIKQLEGLTQDERATLIDLVNTKKKYGLVWEDKPEDVEEQLRTQLPVLREVAEKRILGKELPREIKVVDTKQPDLFSSDENQGNQKNPENQGSDIAPNHILIEGDNLHALTALTFTHEGQIDVIYIDPPYNTGNKDFKYNDSFVDWEDSFKHSKWLSFMKKRLEIAKRLLSLYGKILISIDDNEQAPLKMLCDEVFGENNFLATFIWRGGKRNAAKHISTSHEYMLLYAKSLSEINASDMSFKVRKKGIDDIYKIHKELSKIYRDDYQIIIKELKKWFKSLPEDNPAKDHSHYCNVDKRGVYFASDISRGGGGGPKWEIINPKTGNIVKTPSRGWAFSKIDDLYKAIDDDLVHFSPDDGVPCFKRYLKDNETTIIETTIYKDRRAASKRLRSIIGDDKFDFPKDDEIISYFIDAIGSSKDITVLDFFAGSGTTLHATMQLNAEDGGNRKCILVTNNENNIAEEVCYERNRRVIQGYTNSKGEWVPGLTNNNLRYYKSEFVPSVKTEANKRLLTQTSTDLLCIKEDCYTECTESAGFNPAQCRIFTNERGKFLVVVYHSRKQLEVCVLLINYIKSINTLSEKIKLYAFSPEKETLLEDFAEVADLIEAVPLPEAIYNAYRATFRTLKLDQKQPAATNENELIDLTQDEE